MLSPEITAQFALTQDLDAISTEFAAGNSTQGISDLNNLSSDVLGALINGYDVGTNPADHSPQFFAGLLGDGSLLQHLALTWPEQIATALGSLGETPVAAGEAVTSVAPDFLTGLLSF
ncbi:hypothetical protein [Mycobacterium sp.]|uniref:hypothetical protein n=1 Tax=Mycobacterium sp. TaxID=1785 RepID=UPI003D0BC283